MFLCGALVAKFKGIIQFINKQNLVVLITLYLMIWYLSDKFSLGWGNRIHPLGFLLLLPIVFKVAFVKPNLSDRLLKRNDISYGVYIFHMPVVNYILYKGFTGFVPFLLALVFTVLLAMVSWFVIESPALKFKKNQLRSS